MKNKIYMVALLLSLSFIATGASGQEVQKKYDSLEQQKENIIKNQKERDKNVQQKKNNVNKRKKGRI